MTAPEPGTVFRLEHTDAHLFQVGENRLPGKLSFTSEPAPQVVVTRLIAGTMDLPTPAGEERHAVGDITLIGPAATVHLTTTDAHTRTTTLPLPLLHKVAGQLPRQNHPLRFTDMRPASQALADHWRATCGYVNNLLDHPDLDTAAPLLVANTAHLLAATVLAVFPNTVTAAPDTPVDRTDATSGTVRRAAAFINDHAHQDITLADIAAGAYVTPAPCSTPSATTSTPPPGLPARRTAAPRTPRPDRGRSRNRDRRPDRRPLGIPPPHPLRRPVRAPLPMPAQHHPPRMSTPPRSRNRLPTTR